jgi:integrase
MRRRLRHVLLSKCGRCLTLYLAENKIDAPAHLTYDHAFRFLKWREGTRKKKPIARSTALRDLKVLRLVMRHAVRTGKATANPCDRMGIERPTPKQKRELIDEDIKKIYAALPKRKPWMQAVFQLALETGCRISEADIRLITIDRKNRTLTFENPKGGLKRAFTTILPDGLAEKLAELKKKYGEKSLYPEAAASQKFRKFFRSVGLKDVSMHCTRVTYITRLGRSAVPERVARLAVNHASETIHRTYQRLQVEDVRQIAGVLRFPQPPEAASDAKP